MNQKRAERAAQSALEPARWDHLWFDQSGGLAT
jgi:hypothetical protein